MARQARPAIDETVEISEPIDAVWETITDWERAGEWLPNVSECESAPTEVGTSLPFRYQGQPAVAVIEAAREPEHLIIRRPNGPVDAFFIYDLSEAGQATTVRLRAELHASKGIGLMAWMLRWFLARTDRDQLQRLKALIERNASPDQLSDPP